MAIDILAAAKAAIDLVIRFIGYNRTKREEKEARALMERFIELHRAHDVLPAQIPRVLGLEDELQPIDVSNPKRLIERLDNKMLRKTCELYGVRREWLEGEAVPPYECRYVYRDALALIEFLEEITKRHQTLYLWCFKSTAVPLEEMGNDDLYLVICANTLALGDRTIERFYPLESDWPWDHAPARIGFKTLVFICWSFGIHAWGREAPLSEIQAVRDGIKLPSALNQYRSSARWYPDDYIFTSAESQVAKDSDEALLVRNQLEKEGLLARLPRSERLLSVGLPIPIESVRVTEGKPTQ
jgi:hypothetical protein